MNNKRNMSPSHFENDAIMFYLSSLSTPFVLILEKKRTSHSWQLMHLGVAQRHAPIHPRRKVKIMGGNQRR